MTLKDLLQALQSLPKTAHVYEVVIVVEGEGYDIEDLIVEKERIVVATIENGEDWF